MKKSFTTAIAFQILSVATSLFVQADPVREGGAWIAGPEDAPITIEEYADFQCPYCTKGSNTIDEVLSNYSGKVKLVFRNLPLASHPMALTAAKAFAAVYLQSSSQAYTFEQGLFAHQNQLGHQGESFLYSYAETLGIDVARMKIDMNSEQVTKSIAADQAAAVAHNFRGTPAFMIGSHPVEGAYGYDYFKKVIDEQLNNVQIKYSNLKSHN